MKLLILQLSDIHCTSNISFNNTKIDKIVPALRSIGHFDKLILVFNGDLANTGIVNEIKAGKFFIGKVISLLSGAFSTGFINTYIVPGNHDIIIPKEGHSSSEILKWNKSEMISSEYQNMSFFFEYAESKSCFCSNQSVDFKTFSFGDKKIHFTLINSAPFSTLEKDDKELHYVPNDAFSIIEDSISREKPDYLINIIHHNFEWFEWNSKNSLKKLFYNSDLTLVGHDHISEQASIIDGSGKRLNYCVGGEFSLLTDNCSFNAIILDTESDNFLCYKFVWNEAAKLFQSTESVLHKPNHSFQPSMEFLTKLQKGNKQISDSVFDYFVFPEFKEKGKQFSDDDSIEEITEDVFFEQLKKDRIIHISGESHSGKTTLLKYLYTQSIGKGFLPLFMESSSRVDNNFDKLLKLLVEDQYTGDCAYERFCQEDSSKEIIFIDDLDRISNDKARKKLIENVVKSNRLLVYVSNNTDDIKQIVEEQIDGKQGSSLTIKPFYKNTRDQLVEKICAHKQASSEQTEGIIVALDYLVQTQPYLFTLAPGHLIPYIIYLLNDNGEADAQKTLSIVFETNIRNQLLEHIQQNDLMRYNSLLAFIASFMYFGSKSDSISPEELREQVNQFNSQRRETMNAKQFADNCLKANIFVENNADFGYCFSDNNILAYYVASSLKRELEKDSTKTQHIEMIIQQICFGINDSIIVFLSYLTNNSRFILKICEKSFNELSEAKRWRINDNNLPFLNHTTEIKQTLPTEQDKKMVQKNTVIVEEERHESIKYRKAFDYSLENAERLKPIQALKCVELIARMLVDQYSDLDADEVDGIIESLYDIPFKVIYADLMPVQKNLKELCKHLLDYAKEHSDEEFSEDEILKMIGNAGVARSLNILNNVAYNAASKTTIGILNEHSTSSPEEDIIKLMFFENSRNTNIFIDNIIQLQNKYKDDFFVRRLLYLIARKHILYAHKNKPVDHTQISRLISSGIISEQCKKSLLIEQLKQKN